MTTRAASFKPTLPPSGQTGEIQARFRFSCTLRNLSAGTFRTRPHRSHVNSQSPTGRRVRQFEVVTDGYLKDSGQRAVGSVGALLIREPPAPKAVHGVGGDGLAKLFKGVVSIPALLDLVEQFGQFARHCVICEETGRQ